MTCSNCTDHRTYITEDVDSAIKLLLTKWSREILLVVLHCCDAALLSYRSCLIVKLTQLRHRQGTTALAA